MQDGLSVHKIILIIFGGKSSNVCVCSLFSLHQRTYHHHSDRDDSMLFLSLSTTTISKHPSDIVFDDNNKKQKEAWHEPKSRRLAATRCSRPRMGRPPSIEVNIGNHLTAILRSMSPDLLQRRHLPRLWDIWDTF